MIFIFLFYFIFKSVDGQEVSLYITIQIQTILKIFTKIITKIITKTLGDTLIIIFVRHRVHNIQKGKNTKTTITRTKHHGDSTLEDHRQGITIHRLFDLSKQIDFRVSKESWKISKRCEVRLADLCIRSIALA